MFEQKWAKNMQSWNAHQIYSYQAISKFFIWSSRQKAALQNCYLGFSKFWVFDPKNFKKLIFLEKLKKKSKIFPNFEKTGIYVIVPALFYIHTKFQIDISFFGQVIAKKLFKNDDVKFSNSIFGNSRPRRAKQRPPLDSPWRAASNRYPFYAKISTLKFDLIWPDLDLTLTWPWPKRDLSWPQRLPDPHNRICHVKWTIKHVSHDTFILWPPSDLTSVTWPGISDLK